MGQRLTPEQGAFNEWTCILFVEWMRQYISIHTRKPLAQSTVVSNAETVVSTLSVFYAFDFFPSRLRLTRLTRRYLAAGAKGERRKWQGIGLLNLKQAARAHSSLSTQTPGLRA